MEELFFWLLAAIALVTGLRFLVRWAKGWNQSLDRMVANGSISEDARDKLQW